MKSSIILSSFDEWESVIKKTHDEGKTFGLLSENNRLFRYHISYEDRVKQLNKNVDVTALVFLLDYQTWVDMDPNFVSSIYGKRYFDGIDTVIKERNGTVDYLFIPKEPVMQYVKEAKEIVYSIAPLCPYIEYIDAVQYIKGCYSSIIMFFVHGSWGIIWCVITFLIVTVLNLNFLDLLMKILLIK